MGTMRLFLVVAAALVATALAGPVSDVARDAFEDSVLTPQEPPTKKPGQLVEPLYNGPGQLRFGAPLAWDNQRITPQEPHTKTRTARRTALQWAGAAPVWCTTRMGQAKNHATGATHKKTRTARRTALQWAGAVPVWCTTPFGCTTRMGHAKNHATGAGRRREQPPQPL